MRVRKIHLSLMSMLLIGTPLLADAQNDPQGDIDQCRSLSSASRTRANACGKEDAAPVVPVETEITITLERPTFTSSQCQANLSIDYVQVGNAVNVNAIVENDVCGASSGEFTIRARVRDANGETQSLEFPETWQRTDDQPLRINAEYPIGENAQLLNVRAQRLTCECAAAPAEPPPP